MQGLFDVVDQQAFGGRVVGRKNQLVDAAAKLGAHDPFTGGGGQNQANGLLDVALTGGQGDAAPRVNLQRKGQPLPQKFTVANVVGHATLQSTRWGNP